MNEHNDSGWDEHLRIALGTPARADFESWRDRHADDVAYLNRVVTELTQRKRRFLMKITSATLAAVVIVAVASSFFMTQQTSFAQTVEAIDTAETITWKTMVYNRFYSKDGQRTWLRSNFLLETAYRAPNLYRNTTLDDEGRVLSVEIVDTEQNKALRLSMQSKKATWLVHPTNQYGPGRPFDGLAKILDSDPLELVGQRDVDGVTVNVFRCELDEKRGGKSIDIWLDATTKQLVGSSTPGADLFDPETDPDRDHPPEGSFSKAVIAGSITDQIVFNPELDPELFSFIPPEGFEVVHESAPPNMTEEDLIEWLRVTAQFNQGQFVDTARGVDREQHNTAARKEKGDRTEVEQAFLDLWREYMLDHRSVPIWDFAEDNAVPKTFRYLGKGVSLGDADRIVCWYKLKSTGKYRAVYGDLSVKDIDPDELPLPVEE